MKPLFALLAFLVTAYYRLRLDPSDYALPLTNLEGWPDFKAPTGRVVGTSRGRVHYTLEGNDTDPLVVLVHGLFSELEDLHSVKEHLLKQNFRVLAYDLFGMGWSTAPANVKYDEKLYVGQLAELILALNVTEDFVLVGHSMGGAISTAFTAHYPHKVAALVLVAPAGFPVSVPIYARYHFPLVTDVIARTSFASIVPKRVISGFEGNYEDNKPIIEKLVANRQYHVKYNKGYMPAIMSSLRDFPFSDMRKYFLAVNQHDMPVHVLWGLKDETTPPENIKALKHYIPRAELTILDNMGHCLPNQLPHLPAEAAAKYRHLLVDLSNQSIDKEGETQQQTCN